MSCESIKLQLKPFLEKKPRRSGLDKKPDSVTLYEARITGAPITMKEVASRDSKGRRFWEQQVYVNGFRVSQDDGTETIAQLANFTPLSATWNDQ